jgi:hypothetical protein
MTPLRFHLLRSFPACVLAAIVAVGGVALWRLHADRRGAPDRGDELRTLDPSMPYRIEFGRGSGWHGLDTAKLLQDGTVTLHRQARGTDRDTGRIHVFWETATLKLSRQALEKVVAAVEANRVLDLDRVYREPGVFDGTQWVLWVEQGGKEKSVYFDNRFPGEIVRFAAALDGILAENGSDKVDWHRVAAADAGKHQRELWASIKR